jgi:hypothetical protein
VLELRRNDGRDLVQVPRELVADNVHLEIVVVDFGVANRPVRLERVVACVVHVDGGVGGVVDFAQLARGDDDHGAAVDAGEDIGLVGAAELGRGLDVVWEVVVLVVYFVVAFECPVFCSHDGKTCCFGPSEPAVGQADNWQCREEVILLIRKEYVFD